MEMSQLKTNGDKEMRSTFLVIGITILLFLIAPGLRSVTAALPAAYLLFDRRRSGKTWAEIGLKRIGFLDDFKKTKNWIFMVAVVTQVLTIVLASLMMPSFVDHLLARLPMDVTLLMPTVIMLVIGTFLEELIFRGFIQARLGAFTSPVIAIGATSILFALMHIAQGAGAVVAYDLFWIFVDSLIYGMIFYKTKNLFVSWTAHLLADFVGLGIIWTWFL